MKHKKYRLFTFLKTITCAVVWLLYRPKLINKERVPLDGAIIMCANHKHAADPFLIAMTTKRVLHFLGKIELFRTPIGPLLRGIGTIPVDRSIRDKSATSAAEDFLNEGRAVAIFPEGTRSKTGELLPFKFGAVSLASKTDASIVPIAIKGKYKIFGKRPRVIVGVPFSINGLELEEANLLLKEKIEKLLED